MSINNFKGKHGPLLIAEIGGNHEGNFEYAKKLTKLAIESDVDCIKFQLYTGESIVNKESDPARSQHFKKFELSKDQYIELAKIVREGGKEFLASVWSEEIIDWIDPYLNMYKVGSGDLTAYPLLKKIALIGKPIILSTGLATEQEVIDSVNFIQSINDVYKEKNNLAVLQCTSMYPITNSDANLNVLDRFKELFKELSIGYSDHTVGYDALKYAVVKRAEILEFHFTDEREGKEFRDHKVSLVRDEVKALISEIKHINEFLGDEHKQPTNIEINNNHQISFRRAVYPSRDLREGEIIQENDLVTLRPLEGIDARYFYDLIGKKTKKNIKKLSALDFSFFE